MMLRQEAALDRSIDRKVRILMRLRKESANPLIAPTGQEDGAKMENIDHILASDISSHNSQGVEEVENLKLNELCGNVIENKGSGSNTPKPVRHLIENTGSYALRAGILLKTKGVDGMS
jgi:hypothetical protein